MIRHILVPTDGSENADRAVRFSVQLADYRQQVEVTVIFVHHLVSPSASVGTLPHEQMSAQERTRAQEVVGRAVEDIRGLVTSSDVTVSGRIVAASRIDDGILKVAGEVNADIIVVGTRGLSPLRGAIMGSVSHALIEKAHCPILVVK